MNVDTGHLIRLKDQKAPDGCTPVPPHLHAGKDEAQVSRNSGGKLSKWAAKERKEKQQKHLRERQAAGRAANAKKERKKKKAVKDSKRRNRA